MSHPARVRVGRRAALAVGAAVPMLALTACESVKNPLPLPVPTGGIRESACVLPQDFDREAEEERLEELADQLDEGIVYDVAPYEPDPEIRYLGDVLAVSPDGTRLLARESRDRGDLDLREETGLVIWDTASGAVLQRLDVGTGDACWVSDGERLVVTTRVGADVVDEDGTPLRHLVGHWPNERGTGRGTLVGAVHPLPGERLLTYGIDSTLRLWDLDERGCSPGEIFDLREIGPLGATVSHHGDRAAVAGQAGEPILMVDLEAAARLADIDTGEQHYSVGSFDDEGNVYWSGTDFRGVRAVAPDGTDTTYPLTKGWDVPRMSVSSLGTVVLFNNPSDALGVWDRQTGEVEQLPPGPADPSRATWSPDGTVLYALSATGGIHAWDGTSWRAFELT